MTKYGGRDLVIEFNGTTVGQVMDFPQFGSTRGQINASTYGDEWTDTVPGLQDGSEGTITIAYDPANTGHTAVETAYTTTPDDTHVWTVTHVPAGRQWDVSSKLVSLEWSGPLDGVFSMLVGIKIVNPGVEETS